MSTSPQQSLAQDVYIVTQARRNHKLQMIGINEELKTIEAAMAALSTNPNGKETIKVLREAKYVAALAMTTLATDKPLNDARHAVVTTLSDLVRALETDPAAGPAPKSRPPVRSPA